MSVGAYDSFDLMPCNATPHELRQELSDCAVVHVWRIERCAASARAATLRHLLAPDERQRASDYRRDEPRITYVESRAWLRCVLGLYLRQHPAGVRIGVSDFGKPRLASGDDAWLSFNLAHSGAYTLIAVACRREVGVDVERVRPDVDHVALARAYFTPEEYESLARLDEPVRREAFFTCWVRKEAYLKATGRGLFTPLDSFRVSACPDQPASLIAIGGDTTEAARWSLHDLPTAGGYAAAVAVEGAAELRHVDYIAAP